MADWWDHRQRWTHRWRRWRQRWGRKTSGNSEVRMEVDSMEVDSMEVDSKAVLAEMGQQTLRTLKQALRQELLEEVKAEAFEAAMAELDDGLQRERERLRDAFAKEKQALADELEDELERRTEAIRRQVRDAYEERLETLKDDFLAATAARDQATTLLVSLVTQLLVETPKRYLADAGITELDLRGLNAVLAPQGLRVRSEFRHSARQVVCTLQDGAAQRTVFWREAVKPGAAAEASDDRGGG
jgi:hypothetical protein